MVINYIRHTWTIKILPIIYKLRMGISIAALRQILFIKFSSGINSGIWHHENCLNYY